MLMYLAAAANVYNSWLLLLLAFRFRHILTSIAPPASLIVTEADWLHLKKAFYWQMETLALLVFNLKYLGAAFNDDVTGFVCFIFPGWSKAIRPTQSDISPLLLGEKGLKLRVWHAGTILLPNTWITPLLHSSKHFAPTYPVTPKAGRALWSTVKWQKNPLLMTLFDGPQSASAALTATPFFRFVPLSVMFYVSAGLILSLNVFFRSSHTLSAWVGDQKKKQSRNQ